MSTSPRVVERLHSPAVTSTPRRMGAAKTKPMIAAFALLLGLAGCGGAAISSTEYPVLFAQAQCDWNVRCGGIGRSEQASCERIVAGWFDPPGGAYSYAAAIATGRLRFDAASAAACLAFLRSGVCHIDGTNAEQSYACGSVYRPLVGSSGACQGSNECYSRQCRNGAAGRLGCPGTCEPGTGCDAVDCGNEAFCNPTTQQCEPRRTSGAPCDNPYSAYFCQSGLVCLEGRCQAAQPLGARCVISVQCGARLFCDPVSSQCSARRNEGEACSHELICQDGLLCAASSSSPEGEGICRRVLDFPSDCDPALSTGACPLHTYCDSTSRKCVERTPTGQSCADVACGNELLYCEEATSTCQRRLAVGAACSPPASGDPGDNPCLGGSCDPATNRCVPVCMS